MPMRDPFLSHHAPGFTVYAYRRSGHGGEYARAWTYHQATEFIRDAQAEGYAYGEVQAHGRRIWTWPDPVEADAVIDTMDRTAYLEGDVAGFVPARRRRA